MPHVNTVLGEIHPEQLGVTNLHEHLLWSTPGWEFTPNAKSHYDPPKVFEKVYNDLVDFKSAGGSTIVDCSGIGIGRDPELYAIWSRQSGVNVVACTGLWAEEKILPYFVERYNTKGMDFTIDFMADIFVRELTSGMGSTNIKAGVIKVGNSKDKFTPIEEASYRAAARASKKTGAGIITHGVNFAKKQAEILMKEGVDPSRVIISHLDAAYSLDSSRDKDLAKQGFYIAYDHIGTEAWSPQPYAMPDEKRVQLVLDILKAGYVENLVISCDTNAWTIGLAHRVTPNHTFSHLERKFIPMLLKAGVSKEDIDTMTVRTPKKFLPISSS
jgi:predicted metal-dependent phosphotriesterase family hydrolase